jgi:putative DNA primase/helicase
VTPDEELAALMSQGIRPSHQALRDYVFSAAQLFQLPIPQKEFLVSTFMPTKSFGMVFAPRGLGKSWFAMALAVAVAQGKSEFLGWKIHRQGRALYIDGEMALADVRERFLELSGLGDISNLYVLPSERLYMDGRPICLDQLQEQEAIVQLLHELEDEGHRIDLIIFDNLSTLRRGKDENSNSETQALIDFAVELRHRGYAVLFVHHANKSGEQRGASILEVPMDYVIQLKKLEKPSPFVRGAQFSVEFSKIRGKAPELVDFVAHLEQDSAGCLCFSVSHGGEVDDETMLLRMIAENSQKIRQRDLVEKLGWSLGKVNGHVRSAVQNGLLEKGCVLTPQGRLQLHYVFPAIFPKPPSSGEAELPF